MADPNSLQEVIRGALILVGVVAQGEQPTAEDSQDAMARFNDLIDIWSLDRMNIFNVSRNVYSLTGANSYTFGPGGTLDYPFAESRIEEAKLQVTTTTPNSELPLKIFTLQEYAAIVVKDQRSPIPRGIYKDGAYPLANITLYPKDTGANKLVLYLWERLTKATTLNASLVFPAGYKLALQYSLAEIIAPFYGTSISADAAKKCDDFKAAIKRRNSPTPLMGCDQATLPPSKTFNWLSGEVR